MSMHLVWVMCVCVSVGFVWSVDTFGERRTRASECSDGTIATHWHATTNNLKHFQLHSCDRVAAIVPFLVAHILPCSTCICAFIHPSIWAMKHTADDGLSATSAPTTRYFCIVMKTKAIENNCQHPTSRMPIHERQQQRAHRLCCVINRFMHSVPRTKKKCKIMSNFQRWVCGLGRFNDLLIDCTGIEWKSENAKHLRLRRTNFRFTHFPLNRTDYSPPNDLNHIFCSAINNSHRAFHFDQPAWWRSFTRRD